MASKEEKPKEIPGEEALRGEHKEKRKAVAKSTKPTAVSITLIEAARAGMSDDEKKKAAAKKKREEEEAKKAE